MYLNIFKTFIFYFLIKRVLCQEKFSYIFKNENRNYYCQLLGRLLLFFLNYYVYLNKLKLITSNYELINCIYLGLKAN